MKQTMGDDNQDRLTRSGNAKMSKPQNDPFAFIGSNANYRDQTLENYNQANSLPVNYNQHPEYQPEYQPDQQQQTFTGNHSNFKSLDSKNHLQNRNSKDGKVKAGGFATFGPGGILISTVPFIANRFEIINGKSVPRSLNLSRVKVWKVESIVDTRFTDLFKGPLVSNYSRKKANVLDLLVF